MKRFIITLMCFSLLLIILPVSAASKNEYTALKWAKSVTDLSKDTVQVKGTGVMNNNNPDEECAIIYKDPVSPKGFSCTMRFDKAYGSGSQDGWYSINFSNDPTGLSCIDSTIKNYNLKGVNIIFKLDIGNKRLVKLELARYNPKSGFSHLYGQQIQVKNLKEDWTVDVSIDAKGDLYICGEKFAELGDAIDLIFKSDKAYVGFIGFSESMNEVGFTVKYAPAKSPVTATSSAAVSSKMPIEAVSSSGTTPASSYSAASSEGVSTSSAAVESEGVPSEGETSIATGSSETSSVISSDVSVNSSESSESSDGESEKPSGSTWWIWLIAAAAVVVAGGAVFLFLWKKNHK